MEESLPLSTREAAARALAVLTIMNEGDFDDELFEDLVGSTYYETLQVCTALGAMHVSLLKFMNPEDPLAVVRDLGLALDDLDGGDE